ncbi:protein kinase domain-containing protein [Citrus sinensis]|uniref:Protein kinase domain-containing protein n=1 Tax=Citrus sinensis TaxID=2711 RepID=A0ACB8JKP9_CITSI|nr:protein kinase domain-containing protein [Citrus sinensis]
MECLYKRYTLLEVIREGIYGAVHRAHDSLTGDTVVVKKIPIMNPSEGVPSSVIREVSLLKELKHENIVRLLNVQSSVDSIDLVFENLDFDLLHFMKTEPTVTKNPLKIKKYLHQILHGVAYCHSQEILHRDLKPANFLIDRSKDIVKIADFGLARPIDVPLENYTIKGGSLCYKAPERLLGSGRYSTPVDVWAVACTFAEMVTHQRLFHSRWAPGLLAAIFSIMGTPDSETLPGFTSFSEEFGFEPNRSPIKDLATVVGGLEPDGVDLLRRMLCLDPSKRLTAREALRHEYFKDFQSLD